MKLYRRLISSTLMSLYVTLSLLGNSGCLCRSRFARTERTGRSIVPIYCYNCTPRFISGLKPGMYVRLASLNPEPPRRTNSVVESRGSVVIFCSGVDNGSVGARCGDRRWGRISSFIRSHEFVADGRPEFQAFPTSGSGNTR